MEKLDFEDRKAFVREIDCDYYTDAITYDRVTILDTFAADRSPEGSAAGPSHGEVRVVSRVVGFKKIKFYTNENVGSGELDLPEQQMHTTGYWLTVPAPVMRLLPDAADDRRDGIVGLAFAMRQVAQLLLMCDRHDIGISIGNGTAIDVPQDVILGGGEAGAGDASGTVATLGRGRAAGQAPVDYDDPRVFVYDNYPGGIGLSEPLFSMRQALVEKTRDLIATCPCESGCPSCVGPLGEVGPLAKSVALDILARVSR